MALLLEDEATADPISPDGTHVAVSPVPIRVRHLDTGEAADWEGLITGSFHAGMSTDLEARTVQDEWSLILCPMLAQQLTNRLRWAFAAGTQVPRGP